MKELLIKPVIYSFESFKDFAEEFKLGEKDLILTNEYIYNPIVSDTGVKCGKIFQEKYGAGEPTDVMIDAILKEMAGHDCKRVIGIGGGTVMDIAKIMALKGATDTDALFDMDCLTQEKELILIPTTCGTGSEVTNISAVNRTTKGTKMGLVSPNMYATAAVLIPEFLHSLPYSVFATSSIDALIHAVEAYLGPFTTDYIDIFAEKAIKDIVSGYCRIATKGADARMADAAMYLKASNYAAIAFGNDGCGAVHAMSYALGGKYHVAHGESNYQFFTEVLKKYSQKKPEGRIKEVADMIKDICGKNGFRGKGEDGIEILDELLEKVLHKKTMSEYGATEEDIIPFAESTVANQQRLLKNNYVPLTLEEIREIYQKRL